MIEGLVSTIIPVFNRGAMLVQAVDSVLAQTWRPIEIIIVDDGSSDDTPQVMAALQQAHPQIIHLHRQDNAGPGAARQAGVQLAKGEFVQFLDSDDLLLPEKFSVQVQALRADPAAGISYGKTHVRRNGQRDPTTPANSDAGARQVFPALLVARLWETVTPLYRRSALDAIGPWSPRRQLEDWEFDSRAGAAGIELNYCDQYLAEYVQHDSHRLSHAWMSDHRAMLDRIHAYGQILENAKRAGIAREAPEMRQFVRSLFWMARNAASYGLPDQAGQLFRLARDNAINPGWDYRLFSAAVAVIGWRGAARLASFLERLR
jgi:glycosyltransferase involved in cell wall biosynthesis